MPGHEGFDLTDFSASSVIDPSKCRSEVIPLDPANISSHGIVQHAAMLGQVDFADVPHLSVLGLLDGNLLLQLFDLSVNSPICPWTIDRFAAAPDTYVSSSSATNETIG